MAQGYECGPMTVEEHYGGHRERAVGTILLDEGARGHGRIDHQAFRLKGHVCKFAHETTSRSAVHDVQREMP
jgi:hypothetical protein